MDPQEDKNVLFIGLDFGTTYSGVAWAYSKDPDSIETITSWASGRAASSDKDKAPTVLSFGETDETGAVTVTWGYNTPAGSDTIKWFKLLLLKERDVPIEVLHSSKYVQAQKSLEDFQNSPSDLVACYVRELWEHAVDEIKRSLGQNTLAICELHVVATLPAIWPEYAKQLMKLSLEGSGILDKRPRAAGETQVRFVPEPEAAALATINDMANRVALKPKDTMIVCDAGGGTVDLISYEIQKSRPFIVKEIVKGDGGLCGGVFLDEAFLELIKSKITAEAWEAAEVAEKEKFMSIEWENGIKPEFTGHGQQEWLVLLPDSCQNLAEDGSRGPRSLRINTDEIRQVFDTVTDRIVDLVKRQGNAIFAKSSQKVNYIVLVGGFGRCRYLYDRIVVLAEQFGAEVLQSKGSKPWSAIARGAVVNSLTKFNLATNLGVAVGSRISRHSYGVKHTTNFIEGVHHEEDRVKSVQEALHKARDQIKWFLKQGEDVDDHEPVSQVFFCLLRRQRDLDAQPLEIWATEMEVPPTRAKDPGVVKVCELSWAGDIDFPKVPMWKNPRSGKSFRKLFYKVVMNCDDGLATFEVHCQGKKCASQSVDIEFDTTEA